MGRRDRSREHQAVPPRLSPVEAVQPGAGSVAAGDADGTGTPPGLVQEPVRDPARRRPRGVVVVVVFTVVQGLVLVLLGSAMVVVSAAPRDLAHAGLTRRDAQVGSGLVFAVAFVELVASYGLFRGLPRVRTLYGVIATLQIASSVYALVALRNVQIPSLVVLGISVGVLWLLYGTEETREYFE